VLARGLMEPDRPLAEIALEMAPAVRRCGPGQDSGLYAGLVEEYISSLPWADEEDRP